MALGTHERILDGALRLFASRGVRATHITDIETSAGLKPGNGSFYRHFRSKEAVLDAVVHREIERVKLQIEAAGPPRADIADDVRGALTIEFEGVLDDFERLGPLIAIMGRERGEIPHLSERISEVTIGQSNQVNAARLEQRMDSGQIPRRDALALADVVIKALSGHFLADQFFGGSRSGVDRARFIAGLVDMVAPQRAADADPVERRGTE